MPEYRDSRGKIVTLGQQLGERGGEGAVFRVQGNQNQVAKIWHDPNTPAAAKVEAMAPNPPPMPAAPKRSLFKSAQQNAPFTWPQGILRDHQNRVVGYLMPAIDTNAYRETHHYYIPSQRQKTEQETGVNFTDVRILEMVRNLAKAVQLLHEAGHVIGDINEKNIRMNPQGDVILIDMDSIQFADPNSGQRYRCAVGRPEYTPPRLQGVQNIGDHDREVDDDCFGLAVLVFKFLMGGMHPYSTRFDPNDQNATGEIGTWIKEGYFPYSESLDIPAERKQTTGIYVDRWDGLRDELKILFRWSFDPLYMKQRSRPTPAEWITALDNSIKIGTYQATAPQTSNRRRSQNRAQSSSQNPGQPQGATTSATPPTGSQPNQPSAPTLSRTVRLAMVAGVVGVLALVASCAFLGGLAPVLSSVGPGLFAEPTAFPIAAVEPSPTPNAPAAITATPTETPAPEPTATPQPTEPPTPNIPAIVAATVAAIQPTATPTPVPPPTPTPTAPPTSTPAPTATPVPPTLTPRPPYPDPVLMEQRGSLPGQLGRAPGVEQHVSGCFVGSHTRQENWFYLADRPSETLERARNPILLDYQNSIPEEELRELLPGKCYYVGPIFYRTDQAERRCPGAVYEVSNCAGEEISQSFRMYTTDRPLREITEPPDFSN